AGDLEGLAAQAHDPARRHPGERVIERRVAGLGALAAEAAVALRDDRLRRGQLEIERDLTIAGAQPRRRAVAFGGPIVDPDTEGRRRGAGQSERLAAPTAEGVEPAARDVADGKVGEVELARGPGRRAHHRTGRERDAEERELESEMAAAGRP